MNMDIDDLKKKYRKKTRANIMDIDQLQTLVPMLIREICCMEQELKELSRYVQTIERKKKPLAKKGQLGKAQWNISYDMKKKRLFIQLKGLFDYKSAKLASNAIITLLENVEKGFDVINDIRYLSAISDMKTLFHLRKVRHHLIQAEVGRTVRVVKDKDEVVSVLFGTFFKEGPNAMVTKSVEDAINALENQGKFLSP